MLEETIGVAVFVLRRTARHETEVLLLKRGAGAVSGTWSLVAGGIQPGEREADAALRELAEETRLGPERFYAAPFSARNDDPELGRVGRIGLFVAFVGADPQVLLDGENDQFAWCSVRDAGPMLPLGAQRTSLERIDAEFVRRPPDEALRLL